MADESKVSILLVDDRPDKLLSLQASLEDLDLNIVLARSGAEALRQVLARDFAVILLDINMPNMDGFETAELIRQRKSSVRVPIIFMTAAGDEMYAEQVYSLGGVDFLMTPVVPQVLRSKVAVFVDLFRKTRQVQLQAERLHVRADQLHRLTDASLALNSAMTVQKVAEIASETARQIIGAHQAMTVASIEGRAAARHVAYSNKYARWRNQPHTSSLLNARELLGDGRKVVRLTRSEVEARFVAPTGSEEAPPVGDLMAVALHCRDGSQMGSMLLCEKCGGDFTDDDQAIVVQLAQITSLAIENILFAQDREANRLKDEFLGTLSHELRTPLTAISGWVQLLRLKPDDLGHGLEVIERNVKAQTRLIEDLLDLSRITSGQFRLQKRSVTLQSIVDSTVEALHPQLERKKIDLVWESKSGDAVMGDPDRLQQVFWNLLTNSVKFTQNGGRIEIQFHSTPGFLNVTIQDNGCGIDSEALPHVFERFRQADSSSSRRHGGLGIGLTIVRGIVDLHGGTVVAESEGKGKGAAFTVRLPTAPQELKPRRPDIVLPSNQPLPSLSRIRVLLVDDDPDAREVVGEILQRCDAEVSSAGSAIEALELLDQFHPHILVTDLAMPDRDGFSLLRDVRGKKSHNGNGNGHSQELPAIALTAYAHPEDRAKTRAAGFQAHLPKPVDPGDLIMAVHQFAREKAG